MNAQQNDLKPLVSVIMPVYNTEKYLHEAVDSILNQSLSHIELIAVDDGSRDSSSNILKDYAAQDERVHIFRQPNQGQGVARNNGLAMARGRYIYMMDSDDRLEHDALQRCYELCEANNLDGVLFDADCFGDDAQAISQYDYDRKNILDAHRVMTGAEVMQLEQKACKLLATVWLCFFRTDFLKTHFSGFPAGIIHEDQLFVIETLMGANRLMYIPAPLFHRRLRPASTMTATFTIRNIEGYTHVSSTMLKWAKEYPLWDPIIQEYLKSTLNSVIWLGHQLTLLEKIETWCRFRRLGLSKYVKGRSWAVFWLKR